jgi:Protein of unknown function (DUF3179)
MDKAWRSPGVLLSVSVVLALVSLASSALPLYVIRPFRHQGARELAAALFVKQVGPAVSVACALLALIVLAAMWPSIRMSSRKWPARAAIAVPALLAVAGAFLARVNVYEIMFHPVDSPRFGSAEKAGIDSDDMVIAVDVRGARRAYPIREMAYHHVVNDAPAGEPIVATY